MSNEQLVTFGDNVRILPTVETTASSYADLRGVCWGATTPSVGGVEVMGTGAEDVAINIRFEDENVEDAWFDPSLVQFVDHAGGTTATVGDRSFLRRDHGGWHPT